MTRSDVVLDSWAWWEVLHATPAGRQLLERYLAREDVNAHASAIACGELSARLHSAGRPDAVVGVMKAMRDASTLHDVDPDLAEEAGRLRRELRGSDASASLNDALMLATARRLGATLVSDDRAFRGQPDVVAD